MARNVVAACVAALALTAVSGCGTLVNVTADLTTAVFVARTERTAEPEPKTKPESGDSSDAK